MPYAGPGTVASTPIPVTCSYAMHTSCSSTSVLLALLYALLTQTAFLPATNFLDNKTILGSPIVNVPGTPLAADIPTTPVSSRNIVLAFLVKGPPIPEDEVKDTLIDADQAIADLARNHPNERISNDRFEYRRPNGNMLISIRTNIGEEITWKELDRILQGLHRYMTAGIGSEETHYEVLEFEIEASGQEKPNIGLGLVWYFKPTKSDVSKRAKLPLPISSMNSGTLRLLNLTFPQHHNQTMRRLPDITFMLPEVQDVQEATIFPIPRTSLSLSVHYFGPSIPSQSVKATLQGAMAKIRPILNGPLENDPIENDVFRWILPLSREAGIPVAVTVFTYHGHVITWHQLFDVLYGLYAFTTTFGTDLTETHYQILGFRIVDYNSRRLGVGTISYFRSQTSQLAKRVEATDDGISLGGPRAPTISLIDLVVSNSIVYPVANTDITLTFTFLGETPIPPLEIFSALNDAIQNISDAVAHEPYGTIPDQFRDISDGGHVVTNILVYARQFIRWKEMDQILKGILRFCEDDEEHDRVLVFEIDIDSAFRGRVGFGTLLYIRPDLIEVEKRALATKDTILRLPNSTIVARPSLTSLAVPIPYPIPGTPISLTLSIFGPPIPFIYVNAAFTSALRKIETQVIHHPNDPIPNGRWGRRGAVDKIVIFFAIYPGNKISWQELSFVLAAVLRFMTEAGGHRCRDLGFYIDQEGDVATGYGSVVYFGDDDRNGAMVST